MAPDNINSIIGVTFMSANGIAHITGGTDIQNKESRQNAKLDIAQAKRRGQVVAVDGTISGVADSTKTYFRYWNTHDRLTLQGPYNVDEALTTNSLDHRPWVSNFGGVTLAVPAVNTLSDAETQPAITGTYDILATALTVTIDGVTYTLGVNPELTVDGGGNWTLDLSGSAQTLASDTTYDVVVNTDGTVDTTTNEITTANEIAVIIADAATSLEIWYDGSDITQFQPTNPSNGSGITQWNDKSAFAHNANPTQTGPSARPTYQTAVLNGLSVVRFDGVDECLDINPATWLQARLGVTMFIVAKASAPTNGNKQTIISTDQGDMDVFIDTAGNFVVGSAGGVTAEPTTPIAADTNFHIHVICYDGQQSGVNRLKYFYDKTQPALTFTGTPASTTSNTNNAMSFGCDAGAEFFTGDIAEVLVFNRALTAQETDDVEQYLNTHWALGL